MLALGIGTAAAPVTARPASEHPEAAPATSIQPPPPEPQVSPQVETATAVAWQRLAPDLREPARNPTHRSILVSVLMTGEADLNGLMQRVVYSKPLNGIRWATGQVLDTHLGKLGSIPGVISVISTETYRPADGPGEDGLELGRPPRSLREIRALVRQGDKTLLLQEIAGARSRQSPHPGLALPAAPGGRVEPATIKARDIHGASAAHAKGYTGTGVVVALVDTGVDFAHPDLQDTQARIASGPYAGWPFAYNTLGGVYYALMGPAHTIGPDTYWDVFGDTWYAHTLPVTDTTCTVYTCTANLKVDFGSDAGWPWAPITLPFVWPNTSRSGQYYYTVHPDITHLDAGYNLGLGYAARPIAAPAAVIVADEAEAGVYDTVYVDVDFDGNLTDDKPMRKGDELAGADLYDAAGNPGSDGLWDISAGMLTWIADGTNPPPGVSALYEGMTVPQAGRLLSFVGDEDSHGTNCASDIAAQGVITDPERAGTISPILAGGPVLAGIAPGARIAALQNGLDLPFDSWTLAVVGFDGEPGSGDEAQIVSNSWGSSTTIHDGWDATSRLAHWLNRTVAPDTAFLVSTGNSGHGYGTVAEPDGGSLIDVGASTFYGSLSYFEPVDVDQFTWGAISPWSGRGPEVLGGISPDVVAVGAWGTGANPLNVYYGNGQAAYDAFGGTSMATPIAAGSLALVYQAFDARTGRWPTWQEARGILLNSAHDLGYDGLTQGSGNVDADRGTDIAAGRNEGYWIEPPQWVAGDYRGREYPAFPAIMYPGDTATRTFTIHNTYTDAYSIDLSDVTLQLVGEYTFTLNFPPSGPTTFLLPTWITDITPLIDTYDPDLVRAEVVFPYRVFDTDGNYSADDRWRILFYDWKDLNGDGNLWSDTNGNGQVDSTEIDIVGNVYEYNRFTYGYPASTYLEASVGRDSLSRRHDGVFFGLQRRTGSEALSLQVRIAFYGKADWDWLTLPVSSMALPAGGDTTFTATLTLPADTRPGVYQGAIQVGGSPTQTIPVVVHVAANLPNFEFGAASPDEPIGDAPADNGHLLGGFDWTWRYASGDWRLYYFDVPDGSAGPGKAMIVDTQWISTPTDVDTWIYAAAPDLYSAGDPDFFGPQGVERVGGSTNTHVGDGLFLFHTATGGPREVVGGEIRDGLGFIALHNVLYAGTQVGEPIVGRAYQVEVSPTPVVITISHATTLAPFRFGDAWVESFTSTYTLTGGIDALVYGLSQPQSWKGIDLPITTKLCDWSHAFTVTTGGLIEINARSSDIADIDLYLYGPITATSTTDTADEQIRVRMPPNGVYRICVDNWSEMAGTFDLALRVIQGGDLVVGGLPVGTISADAPVTFTVAFSKAAAFGTTWEGLLYLGPASAPTAIEIPITVHIPGYRAYLPWVMRNYRRE